MSFFELQDWIDAVKLREYDERLSLLSVLPYSNIQTKEMSEALKNNMSLLQLQIEVGTGTEKKVTQEEIEESREQRRLNSQGLRKGLKK